MPVVVWWLRILLAIVFAEAVVAHLRDPSRLRHTISQVGVGAVGPVALATTIADVAVVVGLVGFPSIGGWLALGYLVVVSSALLIAARAGRTIGDCSCGLQPKPFDARLIARNVALAAAGTLVIATPEAVHADYVAGGLAAGAIVMLKALDTSVRRLAAIQA